MNKEDGAEIGEYLERVADGINEIKCDLNRVAAELLEYNCGDISGGIGDSAKSIYGLVGAIGYITNYMKEHSEKLKQCVFTEKDRDNAQQKDNT